MYAFINDISIAPSGITIADSRPLIRTIINVFAQVRQYKIEKIRAVNNFHNTSIGGSFSISGYYHNSVDVDERGLLLNFLANVIEYIPAKHGPIIDEANSKRLFDIYLDNLPSSLLKEAHLMSLPVISFATKNIFGIDKLACQNYTLTESGENESEVLLENFYDDNSHVIYADYLLNKCHEINFAETRWDPFDNPSWRVEVTKQIIEKYDYPNYRKYLSPGEYRARNTEVAIAILEANGWYYNTNITGYNHHREEVWRVYSNDFCNESVYISVDLVEGEFEMQNRRGIWKKTVFFDGTDTGKDYSNDRNSHKINIR